MTIDCTKIKLKQGSNGDVVKQVQTYLSQYGFYDGLIDGDYGSYTVTSVKNFQKACGLVVDGWIGTETCKTLNKLSSITEQESLKKGTSNVYVTIVQQKLKLLGYYTSSIDGEYGSKTVNSVKSYQANNKLLQDGIVGPVTYKKLLASNSQIKINTTGVYTNNKLCESKGGNCLGQITGYHCGPHSVKQALRKFGITKYSESTIGAYAGTTSAGTGHSGLETAIYKIAKNEGIKLSVTWKNFSDLGSNQKERYKKYGELMSADNTAVFHHELYRNRYGHYSILKTVNTNNSNLTVANSLGNKCNSPAYCGYMESRSFGTQQSYLNGISQKSICIITKV